MSLEGDALRVADGAYGAPETVSLSAQSVQLAVGGTPDQGGGDEDDGDQNNGGQNLAAGDETQGETDQKETSPDTGDHSLQSELQQQSAPERQGSPWLTVALVAAGVLVAAAVLVVLLLRRHRWED